MRKTIIFIFVLAGSWIVLALVTLLSLGLVLTVFKEPIIVVDNLLQEVENQEINVLSNESDSYKDARVKLLQEELVHKAIGFCPREESSDCSYPDGENYCLTDKMNCRYEKFQAEENYIVLLKYFSATKVYLYLSDRENIRMNIKSLESGGEESHIETLGDFFYEQLDETKKRLNEINY